MFPASTDEANELATMMADIGTFVDESRLKFITGEWNFEADWDSFVQTLSDMGVDRFMEIRQIQYAYAAG